jgi:uncharacterized protein
MRVRSGSALRGLLLIPFISCCGSPEQEWIPHVEFDSTRIWITTNGDSIRVIVEVARTSEQTRYGLMGRESLDPGSGMIFVFDSVRAPDHGFWMWRTKIPLDVAYIGLDDQIVAIREMEPCESPYPEWCPWYEPGVEYAAALEMNRGWFARNAVGVGARVTVPWSDAW